jgi:predicted esterase
MSSTVRRMSGDRLFFGVLGFVVACGSGIIEAGSPAHDASTTSATDAATDANEPTDGSASNDGAAPLDSSAGDASLPNDAATDGQTPGSSDPSPGCSRPWSPREVTHEPAVPGRKAAMQVVWRSMLVAGIEREYLLAVPEDYDAQALHALVFGFHASGGTREQLRSYVNLELPANGQAVFVYPGGRAHEPGGDANWDLAADSDDLQFVDQLLAEVGGELCIDRKRVFATGHSFGGAMTTGTGCFRGDVFRAIAPIAPGLPWPLGPCVGQVAVFGIHSPKDQKVPYSQADFICTHFMLANHCAQEPECGCNWTDSVTSQENECVQTAQRPWVPGVPIEVSDNDEQPPIFHEYLSCDPGYPLVWADHWYRESVGDPKQLWHAPPPWSAAAIWDFFTRLPTTR